MFAAAVSCVTITTARPSEAPARSSRRTSAPACDVEVAGRLVGQQHVRVVDQRAGDREALLLAAGELMRKRVGDVAQPEPVDQGATPRGRVRRGAAHPPREQHVGLAGELGQQVEELEDEPDPLPPQPAQRPLAGARDALAARP